MPSTTIGATSLTGLQTAFNAFTLANPTLRILGVTFLSRDMVGIAGLEMVIGLNYDLGGTDLTGSPLLLTVFQGNSPADLATQIAAWELITVLGVESKPLLDYLGQRRRTEDYIAAIIHSTSGAAIDNFLAQGPATSRSVITDADSPYAASYGETIFVDATAGDVDVILPAQVASGVTVKRMDAPVNAVMVQAGANTIDGAAAVALTVQYETVRIEAGPAAAEWSVMSLYP